MDVDVRKIVVVVEDVEAARTALLWGLNNLLRHGDVVTLLHVFSSPRRSKKKATRLLRLRGYQLALSFRDICNSSFNTNTEIIVREGDQEGRTIAAVVREIGASTLLAGLHENSFLYRLAMGQSDIPSSFFNCKVLAIKQTSPPPSKAKACATPPSTPTSSTSLDFSQIDISGLQRIDRALEVDPPKIPYRICPSPHAIIWRTRRKNSRNKDLVSRS